MLIKTFLWRAFNQGEDRSHPGTTWPRDPDFGWFPGQSIRPSAPSDRNDCPRSCIFFTFRPLPGIWIPRRGGVGVGGWGRRKGVTKASWRTIRGGSAITPAPSPPRLALPGPWSPARGWSTCISGDTFPRRFLRDEIFPGVPVLWIVSFLCAFFYQCFVEKEVAALRGILPLNGFIE